MEALEPLIDTYTNVKVSFSGGDVPENERQAIRRLFQESKETDLLPDPNKLNSIEIVEPETSHQEVKCGNGMFIMGEAQTNAEDATTLQDVSSFKPDRDTINPGYKSMWRTKSDVIMTVPMTPHETECRARSQMFFPTRMDTENEAATDVSNAIKILEEEPVKRKACNKQRSIDSLLSLINPGDQIGDKTISSLSTPRKKDIPMMDIQNKDLSTTDSGLSLFSSSIHDVNEEPYFTSTEHSLNTDDSHREYINPGESFSYDQTPLDKIPTHEQGQTDHNYASLPKPTSETTTEEKTQVLEPEEKSSAAVTDRGDCTLVNDNTSDSALIERLISESEEEVWRGNLRRRTVSSALVTFSDTSQQTTQPSITAQGDAGGQSHFERMQQQCVCASNVARTYRQQCTELEKRLNEMILLARSMIPTLSAMENAEGGTASPETSSSKNNPQSDNTKHKTDSTKCALEISEVIAASVLVVEESERATAVNRPGNCGDSASTSATDSAYEIWCVAVDCEDTPPVSERAGSSKDGGLETGEKASVRSSEEAQLGGSEESPKRPEMKSVGIQVDDSICVLLEKKDDVLQLADYEQQESSPTTQDASGGHFQMVTSKQGPRQKIASGISDVDQASTSKSLRPKSNRLQDFSAGDVPGKIRPTDKTKTDGNGNKALPNVRIPRNDFTNTATDSKNTTRDRKKSLVVTKITNPRTPCLQRDKGNPLNKSIPTKMRATIQSPMTGNSKLFRVPPVTPFADSSKPQIKKDNKDDNGQEDKRRPPWDSTIQMTRNAKDIPVSSGRQTKIPIIGCAPERCTTASGKKETKGSTPTSAYKARVGSGNHSISTDTNVSRDSQPLPRKQQEETKGIEIKKGLSTKNKSDKK